MQQMPIQAEAAPYTCQMDNVRPVRFIQGEQGLRKKEEKFLNPLDNAGLIIYILSIEKEKQNVEPIETPCRTG